MTGDSRTDLEALRRSGNAKVLALAAVLLGALGAAAWFLFFRPQGIGAAEEADKVLVVRSGRIAGYSSVLERGGFDAAEGELAYWVEKAHDELPEAPEGTDVEVVVTLADHFGYGFVVFENPQGVDFSDLDIERMPPLDEHVRFAALSIGDFAFPHVVTVNPEPSKALRRVEISLLQALFEQPPLKEALPENDTASVDAIQLRSKLDEALADLALADSAERLADEVLAEAERTLAEERGEPQPVRLTEALVSGEPMPTPGGGVLVPSRAYEVVTDDGKRAALAASDAHVLQFSAAPGADRGTCDAVLGGEISNLESPDFVLAHDGGAMQIETATHGTQLWVASGESGCGYTLAGALPATSLDEVARSLPHRSGKLARIGTVAAEATVEIVDLSRAAAASHRVQLTGVGVRDLTWVGADHLAATADDGLVYLIPAREGQVLSFAPMELGRDPTLYEVARLSDSSVVLTVGSSPRRLVVVDVGTTWSELFAQPPVLPEAEAEPEPEPEELDAAPDSAAPGVREEPAVRRLDPSGFETIVLTRAGRAAEPVGSPDGTAVAFSLVDRTLDDPGLGEDAEIALISAQGGTPRLLTRNGLRERAPRFTSDGAWVLFETRLDLAKSDWRVAVPRAVAVR